MTEDMKGDCTVSGILIGHFAIFVISYKFLSSKLKP